MFGTGRDPYQGQQGPWGVGPGPLGDLQNQVASVLNSADQNHVYVPTGPGNPIITLPRPQADYRAAGYRPAAPMYSGQHRPVGRATTPPGWTVACLLLAAALIVTIVVALT
jgi:hypothetical protein